MCRRLYCSVGAEVQFLIFLASFIAEKGIFADEVDMNVKRKSLYKQKIQYGSKS